MIRTERVILSQPGYFHWSKEGLVMLVDNGRYQSKNSTRFFERWKELYSISRRLRQNSVGIQRRTAVALFAFRLQDEEIRLRDMVDRARFERSSIQQAPYQINR